MDIEKVITETFTAHEHLAPDGDKVLAAARQRIDRKRNVLSRPVTVAAAVVALALAAVAIVGLNRPDPAGPDNAQGAAEVQVASPVSTTQPKPAVDGLTMPYSLDWLPPGEVAYITHRINIGAASDDPKAPPLYGGEYMLTVTVDGQVLNVDVQQMRMVSVETAAFKSGPGGPVIINGRQGVESSRSEGLGGYELYLAHPDGGSMYVNVAPQPGSTAHAQQLVEFGRRIAQNIRFPGATTVTPLFGLRDLPNGMRICAFEVAEGINRPFRSEPNTRYSLGTCGTMPPIMVGTTTKEGQAGTPGQPVQGHATRYLDEKGYRTLRVLDAVNGNPIAIAGRVPLTELYDIANRLVLPH
jgi:hypothetical protein